MENLIYVLIRAKSNVAILHYFEFAVLLWRKLQSLLDLRVRGR